MDRKKDNEIIKGPINPDEFWWASVLEDVEARYNPESLDVKLEQPFEEDLPNIKEPNTNSQKSQIVGDQVEIEWSRVKELFNGDDVVLLNVSSHNKGGLLVQGEGIQGFVPASHLVDLSPTNLKKNREKTLSAYIGQSLQLKVIECDQDKGRIVLSERAAQAEPGKRLELLSTLEEGDRVKGRVTTITDFGVFVDLGGIEGLIHISELSWGRVCHPREVVSIGDEVEVYILQIDRNKSRLALSLKRLCPNPWDNVNSRYFPGKITKAVITNIVPFGAFARLEEGLDGLIHISEFGEEAEKKGICEIIAEGQVVEVCILHIDPRQQRLGLSLNSNG